VDIFEPWKRYREWMRGRELSYPRLLILMIILAVGFYGYRWTSRYIAKREAAKPVRCEFHQDVPQVKFVEETEEIINTAVCPSELQPEALWAALTDYRSQTKAGFRPPSVEFAQHLTKPGDLETISKRWPEEMRSSVNPETLKFDESDTAYIYQEQNQINLVTIWTVLGYRTLMANETEGVYRLNFEQPDGLGSTLFYRGHFRLEPNPNGKGTLITFVLRQAMPNRLSGQGLLGMASRTMVMGGYLEGFHPYMEAVVAGLERLAKELAGNGKI
jgi:hypothetical protein